MTVKLHVHLRLIQERAAELQKQEKQALASRGPAFLDAAEFFSSLDARSLKKEFPNATLLWHWDGRGMNYTVVGVPNEQRPRVTEILSGHRVKVITTETMDNLHRSATIQETLLALAQGHPAPGMEIKHTLQLTRVHQVLTQMHNAGQDERLKAIYQHFVRLTPGLKMPPAQPRRSSWHGLPSQNPSRGR